MLKFAISEGGATFTFASPPQNRLGGALVQDLAAAFQQLVTRADIRVRH